MRVAAVGWLASIGTDMLDLAAAQAAVSHDHPDAIAAARAVALSIFLLRKHVAPRKVRERLTGEFHYDLSPERALSRDRGFDVSAASTVPPALAAASEFPDWEGAVRAAICLGGDADTLACTTGAAEALHGLPNYVAEQAPRRI